MPPKSKDLQRLTRRELGPLIRQLGFRNWREGPPVAAKWLREHDGKSLAMWLQASQRNYGDDPAGYEFTFELVLVGAPGSELPAERLPALLTDEERERLRDLQNSVLTRARLDEKVLATLPGVAARLDREGAGQVATLPGAGRRLVSLPR